MVRKGLNLLFIFLLFFTFSFSQKVITNRTLKKYHHSTRKRVGKEKRNYKKQSMNNEEYYSKENIFYKAKNPADEEFLDEIVKDLNRYMILNANYSKQLSKCEKIYSKVVESKTKYGNAPQTLLRQQERESKELNRIRNRMVELEDKIARELKKADEKGLLKDKVLLDDFHTLEERKKIEKDLMGEKVP